MNQQARAAALEELYEEIHNHYKARDKELVRRRLVSGSVTSRVVLLGQALAEKTQRLSGIPYCFPPPENPQLSKGGRTLDEFLSGFGYTINPSESNRQYAHHTDLAHYFPGKKGSGFGDIPPSPTEIAHDREWFEREVRVLQPAIIVALGKDPANEFAQRYLNRRLSKLGALEAEPLAVDVGGVKLRFLAVHHPSGAFQHPSSKERYARVADHIKILLAEPSF